MKSANRSSCTVSNDQKKWLERSDSKIEFVIHQAFAAQGTDMVKILRPVRTQKIKSRSGLANLGQRRRQSAAARRLKDKTDAAIGPMKDRNKDIGRAKMVSLLGRKTVAARLRQHLVSAVSHLRVVLPNDQQMADFTLQVFGLQLIKIESATDRAISFRVFCK